MLANVTSIPKGSTVYVKSINGEEVENIVGSETSVVLLSNRPHSLHDKFNNKYIDMTAMTVGESQYFYFNEEQLFTYESKIETVYPHIRKI